MNSCQSRFVYFAVAMLGLMAGPAGAFEILLDIDLDGDPATINDYTENTTTTVFVVLAPTTPGEKVGPASFGLGGSCLECDGVQSYGTWFDLDIDQDWVQAPGWSGRVDGILYLGCYDDPDYHTVLFFEPEGGGTVTLAQPIFLGAFQTGVNPPDPGCPTVPSNLAAFGEGRELWNYVQIGGPAVAVESHAWGRIKAMYR